MKDTVKSHIINEKIQTLTTTNKKKIKKAKQLMSLSIRINQLLITICFMISAYFWNSTGDVTQDKTSE